MNFRQHVEELDKKLGKKLHSVESGLLENTGEFDEEGKPIKKPVLVYFYLSTVRESLDSVALARNGRIQDSGIHMALTRARDADGRLLWPTDAEREKVLDDMRLSNAIATIGFSIANAEKAIIGENVKDSAAKN